MAVESTMLPIGTTAIPFKLINTIDGRGVELEECSGAKGTLVIFICNHCPYVLNIIEKLITIGNHCIDQGIGVVAISSNDVVKYPEDSPEKMKIYAEQHLFNFPYLYDETQAVAKAYQAACTPEFYLFDENQKLFYRGRFDDSTPKNGKDVTGEDLTNAINSLLANDKTYEPQWPSIGCGIKWKE